MRSLVEFHRAVSEKTGVTDKQTNRQTNRQTKPTTIGPAPSLLRNDRCSATKGPGQQVVLDIRQQQSHLDVEFKMTKNQS